LETVVEPEAGRAQGRVAIIGQGAAHGQAVSAGGLGRGIGAGFELPFERPHAADLLFEFLLGMAIRFVDRLGGFAEVVKLAQLMRHPGQRRPDGPANGVLTVGEHRLDRHRQRLLHFAQQGGEVVLRGAEQTAGQQDLPGQAVAQDPDHLVAHVRLQPIEGQQHAALLVQPGAQPGLIGQAQGQQFFVAFHEVGHRALRDVQSAGAERLVQFRDGLMRGIALEAEPGDHVQAELTVREGPATFFFRPIRPMIAGARPGLAPADFHHEAHRPVQGHHGARGRIGDPERTATAHAAGSDRFQHALDSGGMATLAFGPAALSDKEQMPGSLAAQAPLSPVKFAAIEKNGHLRQRTRSRSARRLASRDAPARCGDLRLPRRDQYRHTSDPPLRAGAGRRARVRVCSRNYGRRTTLLAALTPAGLTAPLLLEGAVDTAAFVAYLAQVRVPALQPGQHVILDNLSCHRAAAARQLIEAAGCTLHFLPTYSPDFNPIELAFAKLQTRLRAAAARTQAALDAAIPEALEAITQADAQGWFRHCGYSLARSTP
jgi:transposase